MNRNEAGKRGKRCPYLTPADKHVFLVLLEIADNADCAVPDRMTPSVAALTEWTSLSRRSVLYAIGHLKRHGWLEGEPGGGRGHKTRYRLVSREPDAECDCVKGAVRKGAGGAPKGCRLPTERVQIKPAKGAPGAPERVQSNLESSQVNAGIARRDSREGRAVVPRRCCRDCGQPLLLATPGRDLCEACRLREERTA